MKNNPCFFLLLLIIGITLFLTNCQEETFYPPHEFPNCPQQSTLGMTLYEKAQHYDQLVELQHIPDGLLRPVRLTEDFTGVVGHDNGPSMGYWTGLYIGSQVYRYMVTGEAQALENVRKCVKGLYDLQKITGVPGLWGRCYSSPYITDLNPPTVDEYWRPGSGEYEGWLWHADVSQDSYSGLIYAMGVVAEYIEDEQILGWVRELSAAYAHHMIDNKLQIIDYDGEITKHGYLYATAPDHFPGFHAMLTLSWIKVAYYVTKDSYFNDYYHNCLLNEGYQENCREYEDSYLDYLDALVLYTPNCKENYNNFLMTFLAMHNLMAYETKGSIRKVYKDYFENKMWQSDLHIRDIRDIGNSYYTFLFASRVGYREVAEPEEYEEAIVDAICTLKRFPETKARTYQPPGNQESVCLDRGDSPNAAEVIPIDQRGLDEMAWRSNPFGIPDGRPADLTFFHTPGDYLAAYWMGRYYGFIDSDT